MIISELGIKKELTVTWGGGTQVTQILDFRSYKVPGEMLFINDLTSSQTPSAQSYFYSTEYFILI